MRTIVEVSHRQYIVNGYIAAVWVAVVVGLVATWHVPARDDLAALVAFVALTIVARAWKLNLYRRGHTAIYPAIVVAGALHLGPTAGVLLGIVAGLIHWPWKSHPRQYLFDAGQIALAAMVIARLPLATGPWAALPRGADLLVHGLIVGAFTYLLNWGLVVTVMALDEWASPLGIWQERCAWLAPHYVVYGCLAVGMDRAATHLGLAGIVVFALPLFMMRLVTQQYLDRTRDGVEQLRAAHHELSTTHAELSAAHEELAQNHAALERAYGATRLAFSGMLQARDDETDGHSERVASLAVALGRGVGLAPDALAALEMGAQLHDIGKVGVADAILHKPGSLTPEEWVEMRRHPVLGGDLVAQIPFLNPALPVIRHHHERWDGTGYPDGLRGEDIPLAARIFAVADVYDALVSDRPYRRGMAPAEAIAIIEGDIGTHFDPAIVGLFLDLVDRGELGRVCAMPFPETSNLSNVAHRRRASDWAPSEREPVVDRLRVVPARS